MWKNCDVQSFLLLPTVFDLRLLFGSYLWWGPIFCLLDAGIALQGLGGLSKTPRSRRLVHPGSLSASEEACGHFEVGQMGAHSEFRSEKVRK